MPTSIARERKSIKSELDIDRISLEQALLDVEVANARVIDLARRLTEMNQELLALRAQLARGGGAGEELAAVRAENETLRSQALTSGNLQQLNERLGEELFRARAEIQALRLRHHREPAAAEPRAEVAMNGRPQA